MKISSEQWERIKENMVEVSSEMFNDDKEYDLFLRNVVRSLMTIIFDEVAGREGLTEEEHRSMEASNKFDYATLIMVGHVGQGIDWNE